MPETVTFPDVPVAEGCNDVSKDSGVWELDDDVLELLDVVVSEESDVLLVSLVPLVVLDLLMLLGAPVAP